MARRHLWLVDALLLDLQGLLSRVSAITHHINAMESKLRWLRSISRAIDDGATVLTPLQDNEATVARAGSSRDEALARGQAALKDMVRAKELVPRAELARAWSVPLRKLVAAEERHELFSMKVAGRRYYPAELLHLERRVVAAICVSLFPMRPGQKFIFWKRAHGSLQGMTVMQRLAAGNLQKDLEAVLRLAAGYSDEDRIGHALEIESTRAAR